MNDRAQTPDAPQEGEYRQFRRTAIAEMADWRPDFDMTGVSVSEADAQAGSPKPGDKIARNPKNHADRWLVAADYFADNFEPMTQEPERPAAKLMPCGHPESMVESSDEGTSFCGGCAVDAALNVERPAARSLEDIADDLFRIAQSDTITDTEHPDYLSRFALTEWVYELEREIRTLSERPEPSSESLAEARRWLVHEVAVAANADLREAFWRYDGEVYSALLAAERTEVGREPDGWAYPWEVEQGRPSIVTVYRNRLSGKCVPVYFGHPATPSPRERTAPPAARAIMHSPDANEMACLQAAILRNWSVEDMVAMRDFLTNRTPKPGAPAEDARAGALRDWLAGELAESYRYIRDGYESGAEAFDYEVADRIIAALTEAPRPDDSTEYANVALPAPEPIFDRNMTPEESFAFSNDHALHSIAEAARTILRVVDDNHPTIRPATSTLPEPDGLQAEEPTRGQAMRLFVQLRNAMPKELGDEVETALETVYFAITDEIGRASRESRDGQSGTATSNQTDHV